MINNLDKLSKENIATFTKYYTAHNSSLYWVKHSEDDFNNFFNVEATEDPETFENEDPDNKEFKKYFSVFSQGFSEDKDVVFLDYIDMAKNAADYWLFKRISEASYSLLTKDYKPQQVANIKKDEKIQNRIKSTLEALKNDSIRLIVDPVFNYHEAISTPRAYNKDTKTLYLELASPSLHKHYLLRGYWDTFIARKNAVSVISYRIIYLDKTGLQVKDKVKLTIANKVNVVERDEDNYDDDMFCYLDSYINNPTYTYSSKRATNVYKAINVDDFLTNYWHKDIPKEFDRNSDNCISKKDTKSPWGSSPHSKLVFETLNPEFKNVHGGKYGKQKTEFFENKYLTGQNKLNENVQKIFNKECNFDESKYEIILAKINKPGARVQWYDFEGFSLPFPPLDNIKPYHQIVNQVSIVTTQTIFNNDRYEVKEIPSKTKNILCDPKTISLDDFYYIISEVYGEGYDAYVVYNKGYELTRMDEIIKCMTESNYDAQKILDASQKLAYIRAHTVDLADVFTVVSSKSKTSKDKKPSIKGAIFLAPLKAKYSIKLVEKLVTKNNIKLKHLITPYKSLKIQNGLMAMNAAISRYASAIGDQEWKIKAEQLKTYCHNDVVAMIMAYDLGQKIAHEGFNFIDKDLDIYK